MTTATSQMDVAALASPQALVNANETRGLHHQQTLAVVGAAEAANASMDPYGHRCTMHDAEILAHSNLSTAQALTQYNCSVVEFLLMRLGQQQEPLYIAILMTVIYSVLFVCGLVGNIATCLVIIKIRFMHTATNFYLMNLAVADCFVLMTGLPTETFLYWQLYPWPFGRIICWARNFVTECCTDASILTVTAFTTERFLAICYPLSFRMNPKRTRKVIAGIWVFSSLFSAGVAAQFDVVYQLRIPESAMCVIRDKDSPFIFAFTVTTLVFFILPMFVIGAMYIRISQIIFQSTRSEAQNNDNPKSEQKSAPVAHARNSNEGRKRSRSDGNDYNELRNTLQKTLFAGGSRTNLAMMGSSLALSQSMCDLSRKQTVRQRHSAVRMLVAVVIAFFVCYAPFNTERLMALYVQITETSAILPAWRITYFISGVFFYLSSTINPFLYSIMSSKFRKAFRQLWAQRWCLRRIRQNSGGANGAANGGGDKQAPRIVLNPLQTGPATWRTTTPRMSPRASPSASPVPQRRHLHGVAAAADACVNDNAAEQLLPGGAKPQERDGSTLDKIEVRVDDGTGRLRTDVYRVKSNERPGKQEPSYDEHEDPPSKDYLVLPAVFV